MELFNVKIEGKTGNSVTATFVSESYEDVRKIKAQLFNGFPKVRSSHAKWLCLTLQ